MSGLSKKIPLLKNADQKTITAFEECAIHKSFKQGESLAFEGDSCPYFFIILSGRLRVFKIGENGREITLYYVNQYESCVLTAFCILSQTDLPAYAVAQTDLEMVIVPSGEFRRWIETSGIWRTHTFNTLSQRLNEILMTVEKVTFQRVDVRIANFLLNAPINEENTVLITHEKLARELGTSRVVVSRILEDFKKEEIVHLSRGVIHLKNRKALTQKSKQIGLL